MSKQAGFSLIEIMVVVVIIGILMAAVATQIGGESYKAQVGQTFTDFNTLSSALERYKLDNFNYPTEEQGLDALVNKPDVDPIPKSWKRGGYIQKQAIDPWGNEYGYALENGRFVLYSLGSDGVEGGEAEKRDIESSKRASDYQLNE